MDIPGKPEGAQRDDTTPPPNGDSRSNIAPADAEVEPDKPDFSRDLSAPKIDTQDLIDLATMGAAWPRGRRRILCAVILSVCAGQAAWADVPMRHATLHLPRSRTR
jgi:hypothetical protein